MYKFGLSVLTFINLLAFIPYNLKEGPGIKKVTVIASETFDPPYMQHEVQVLKDTWRQMHKGAVYGSAAGIVIVVALVLVFL
jgi:hypothetical protein